jgi:hypothetical protein
MTKPLYNFGPVQREATADNPRDFLGGFYGDSERSTR